MITSPPAVSSADSAFLTTFAEDVREYLGRTPRQLPSKYLYDDLGSALFEAICRLPWYQITRAESSLLTHHAREMFQPLEHPLTIAELGCGSGEKLAIIVGEVPQLSAVQLIDISEAALSAAGQRLRAAGVSNILSQRCTYEEGPAHFTRCDDGPLAVLFLGSNIGNFDPPAARQLLCRIRGALRHGDVLLLGADLVKPEPELLLAYDDPLQVTAAFNRNLLRRINDDLGGTFDLDGFAHRAIWNAAERRVEMHLVSRRHQQVEIAAADYGVTFQSGELIWTESSYKYSAEELVRQGLAAGFDVAQQWIDEKGRFAVTRFSF